MELCSVKHGEVCFEPWAVRGEQGCPACKRISQLEDEVEALKKDVEDAEEESVGFENRVGELEEQRDKQPGLSNPTR